MNKLEISRVIRSNNPLILDYWIHSYSNFCLSDNISNQLKKYNAKFEYGINEAHILFETEEDMIGFMLEWS